MKTVNYYDFINALLICKSAISCTFGHMLHSDIFHFLICFLTNLDLYFLKLCIGKKGMK